MVPYCHTVTLLSWPGRLLCRNDPTSSSSLRLVCLQIQFVQLSSRTIKLVQTRVQTRQLSPCSRLSAGHRHLQSHAEPEMLTIIILSLLPILLLTQEISFHEELLLHPDLVEDDFSLARQSNSTATATTTSLLFGVAAVLFVSSEISPSHRVLVTYFYQNFI